MNTPRTPLDDEERALAARLARLGGPAGPPPAVDAGILAAARRAVERAPAPRRRWPLAVGAAASVVFAVGIAWQLRPGQDGTRAYSEADFVRAPGAGGPSAAEELPVAVDSAAPVAQAVAPAPSTPADDAAGLDAAKPTAAAAPLADAAAVSVRPAGAADARAFPEEAKAAPAPPPPPPAPPEPPIVFDEPSPVASPAPAAAANTAGSAARETPAPARRAAQEAAAEGEALDRIDVTGSRLRQTEGFSSDELDEDPPATADSPQVQRAWLQRIRDMVANGDADGARASLGEFKRRYPHYDLPDDLRDLAP